MRKYLLIMTAVVALVAVVGAGAAFAAKDTIVRAGNLELTVDGSSGVTPKALSKTKYTPVAFTAAGSIRTLDNSQPPALKEVLLEAQNSAVDVKGYPTCSAGQLQARDTKAVEAACKSAIIGKGTTTVSVAFPEQAPIPAKSPLLVFNGGVKGGVTTFYIHAYLTQPITTAIVTTVKIKKAGSGLKSVTTIPVIAGGAGSVKDFSLTINKKFQYKGKQVSVLSAKCPAGKLQAHVTGVFSDNTKLSTDVLRVCTPKG